MNNPAPKRFPRPPRLPPSQEDDPSHQINLVIRSNYRVKRAQIPDVHHVRVRDGDNLPGTTQARMGNMISDAERGCRAL